MGKRSRKKRAKQKLLQQQKYFTQRVEEGDDTEDQNNQESLKSRSEKMLFQSKKETLFTSSFLDKTLVAKSKKIGTYVVTALIVFIGLFGVYKLATRPLPGTSVADLGNEHIPSATTPHIAYNSKPPTSGPHLDPKADWGIHDQQISDELQLHNLEDGGVLVQYDCDGQDCSDLVNQLTAVAEKYKDKVIVAPYSGLDQKIVLTAWNRIDAFDEFDEKRITAFINSFRGVDHHKK